jgi:hypothetical protein
MNEKSNELARLKKDQTGEEELKKERESRIEKLKAELEIIQEKFEKLEIEHGSLVINYEKVAG